MTTLTHVPEAARDVLLDGIHAVEHLAEGAAHALAPVADRALDLVLAPLAPPIGELDLDDLELDESEPW